jgi:flagellar hook-length control protein FliK
MRPADAPSAPADGVVGGATPPDAAARLGVLDGAPVAKRAGDASGADQLEGVVAAGAVRERPLAASAAPTAAGAATALPTPDGTTPVFSAGGATGPTGPMHLDVDLGDEGLGPLRLRASTIGGELHVALASGDAHVRAALAAHAPELRREMEAAGLNPSSLDVGASTSGSDGSHGEHAAGSSAQQQSAAENGSGRTVRDRYATTGSRPGARSAANPRPRPTSSRLDLLL